MGDLTKDFDSSEFKCKCGCGAFAKREKLYQKLQQVREKVKMPVTVTSGTRCVMHNREVGGVDTSAHLDGLAADITCNDNWLLLRACLSVFNRVGIGLGLSYLHVDIDEKKPQKVIWCYGDNGKRLT